MCSQRDICRCVIRRSRFNGELTIFPHGLDMLGRNLVWIFLLSMACTPLLEGETWHSPHTDIAGAVSRQAVVSDDRHHVLVGQVMILNRRGEVHYLAEIGQVSDGVHRRLRMDSAWRDGDVLPFRGLRRTERFCIGLSNCQGFRTGTFAFTPETFAEAVEDGFRAHLIGPDAVIDIYLPPELFVDAAERAGAEGVIETPFWLSNTSRPPV